jgi:hypothetical protein
MKIEVKSKYASESLLYVEARIVSLYYWGIKTCRRVILYVCVKYEITHVLRW